ncbi:Putative metabolite transport protein YwtG [Galdieria sulphuraria]|nr:Putative metabolite transport protein YwtG [Galdieria sulphuraria]
MNIFHRKYQDWIKDIPLRLYFLALIATFGGSTVGIDIALVNGAQLFFVKHYQLGATLHGLTTAATLLGALIGSSFSTFINSFVGRKGALGVASFVAVGAGIMEALVNIWGLLLTARIILGVSFGIFSSTVPIYLSECAPARVRGMLTGTYQLSVTLGLFFGAVSDAIFVNVSNGWRFMLGTVIIPPLLCITGLLFTPESPRWLIHKRRYPQALASLRKLRTTEAEAIQDMNSIKENITRTARERSGHGIISKIITIPHIRHALVIGIFLQLSRQLSGVNAMLYYFDVVLRSAGMSVSHAVYVNVAYGAGTVIFTLPMFWIVDRFGRRVLLVYTMPIIACMSLLVGLAFLGSSQIRMALSIVGFLLFRLFYSPSLGPISWVITAEIFPLEVRSECLSICTFFSYAFNFVVSFSFPDMMDQMKTEGAFAFFAGCTIIDWIIFFLFVPETKGLDMEVMDQLFRQSWSSQASQNLKQLDNLFPWFRSSSEATGNTIEAENRNQTITDSIDQSAHKDSSEWNRKVSNKSNEPSSLIINPALPDNLS